MKWIFIALVFPMLFYFSACTTKDVLTRQSRILDSANVLTPQEEDSLFYFIRDLNDHTGPQIAIVTIDTLTAPRIEDYSMKVVSAMNLGREKFNDGILITVAIRNRRLRIEVGTGLEKIIKDEIANKIILVDMAPRFKTGDYFGGLRVAVMKMKTIIEHDKRMIGY